MKSHRASVESLADIFEKSLKYLGFDRRLKEYRLRLAWTRAVGPLIAQQAQPVRFARGVLTVAVKSPVWVQELQMMLSDILSRLRRYPAGRGVSTIRFRVGNVEAPEQPTPDLAERLAREALTPETMQRIDQVCATVEVPDLREAFRCLAEKDAKLQQLRCATPSGDQLLKDQFDGRITKLKTGINEHPGDHALPCRG